MTENQDHDSVDHESEDNQESGGLSWVVSLGAVCGLMSGVITGMLLAFAMHQWFPQTRAAEVTWEIGGPLLGVLGVIAGSYWFRVYLKEKVATAVAITLAVVVFGFVLVFQVVGFPWRH